MDYFCSNEFITGIDTYTVAQTIRPKQTQAHTHKELLTSFMKPSFLHYRPLRHHELQALSPL